ncbi:HPP family-domain-containing protein [Coprinopsis sp. MPI-PUGE-AT-0042]|nr:HPP family-domain-containing protein [Coprinopsis sp. MPI-PUGE-AT-0042]
MLGRRFGYRISPVPPQPNHMIWIWSFCGLAMIQIVSTRSSHFVDKVVPPLITSYGASAFLIYGGLDDPLVQPHALIGGRLLSAILSTTISKLFLVLPPNRFTSLQFLASTLSTATAIVLMQMTGTSHLPAGATALIPILDDRVRALGWDYVNVVLLTSTIMGIVAMCRKSRPGLSNGSLRWPVWWISPPAPISGTLVWPISEAKQGVKPDKGEAPTTMGTGGSAVRPAKDPTSTLLSLVRDEGKDPIAKEEV